MERQEASERNKYGFSAGWGSKSRPEPHNLLHFGSRQPPPLPYSPLVHSSMHLSVGKRIGMSVCVAVDHQGPYTAPRLPQQQ